MARLSRIVFLVGLLFAMAAFGQSVRDSSTANSFTPQRPSTLQVDVDMVLVNATVTDPSNRSVSGLGKEYFQIWEDKIEQEIEYFSSEQLPLSVGIIFDVSGSMEDKLEAARAAADTFMKMGDRGDEYFLVQFSDSAHVEQDFTSDITRIQNRLLFTRAKGGTALYDALYLGMEQVSRGKNPRKALLLITDGEDNHSRYSFSDVKEFARERDVLIYAIGIVGPSLPGMVYSGRGILNSLADLTGGIAFFPDGLGALDDICGRIGADLKTQYMLGYRPLNRSTDGRWRKIRVKINTPHGMPHLNVRAKNGYYASAVAKAMN